MSPSSPRFDPMQILDADWRKRVWKGWLKSRWLGIEDVPPTPPDAEPEAGGARTMPPPPAANVSSVDSSMATPGSLEQQRSDDCARQEETRRHELRTRFDHFADRLGGIEDNLESLVKRFALNSIHQRRHEQRAVERLDTSGDLLERMTLALEGMQATLERVEKRVDRLERKPWEPLPLRSEPEADVQIAEKRSKSHITMRPEYEDYSDLDAAFTQQSAPLTREGFASNRPVSIDVTDTAEQVPLSGPSIHGSLSEMSLGTVLAMLELERRTGLLQVSSEEGATVTATLRNGAIVGARRREIETCPVEVVREALRYKNGYFLFRQSNHLPNTNGPARSVGSVLLEASSRNDEAARTG